MDDAQLDPGPEPLPREARWRLVLGAPAEAALGAVPEAGQGMDRALGALYDEGRKGHLGPSHPNLARWLGDIRTFFPTPVVSLLQQDAIDRLDLQTLLLEPETLATLEPDVHLAATLVSLAQVMPERTRETARAVVRRVVQDLERRLRERTLQAARGALARATRSRRPRVRDIDWDRTIRRNLSHYDPDRHLLFADRLVGRGRRQGSLSEVFVLVDQSASMASSVVYASVFGAALASLSTVRTELIAFDTAVVDLTPRLEDPVEVLFGCQLGGGTDLGQALSYARGRIRRPADSVLLLISDLFDGGEPRRAVQEVAALVRAGVRVISLLALSDDGVPAHDAARAAEFAALGVPCFGCTPDEFPELLALALGRADPRTFARHGGAR